MLEVTMPAIDAQDEDMTEEVVHYECAFHILPTIADEEVSGLVEGLKTILTRSGGTVTAEEIPERYDLAYDIVKHVDGTPRRFNATHFGWVRFTLSPAVLGAVIEDIRHLPEMVRFLIIRLTKEDIQKPFSIVGLRAERARDEEHEEEVEVPDEVPVEALDQSLEKLTTE
jgi:ribosomal protein S6